MTRLFLLRCLTNLSLLYTPVAPPYLSLFATIPDVGGLRATVGVLRAEGSQVCATVSGLRAEGSQAYATAGVLRAQGSRAYATVGELSTTGS